jgi:diacylglycerol kinase (ATP)
VKALVIFNPIAGATAAQNAKRTLAKLEALKAEHLRVTRKTGDAERWTRSAIKEGCRYIIAAGGDGTLNEVVNGAGNATQKTRLGILPLGTGNDFARTLNLPVSIEENIDILRTGEIRPVDLVRIKSDRARYFVNVSAGGFSGIVRQKITPAIKHSWGPLAYIRGAAAALPKLHAYKTRIVLDDAEQISCALYNVVVANGRYVAGGLPIAPEADPGDGWLDVVLIPKRSGPEIALLAAEIVLGKHLPHGAVTFRRAKKVEVSARPGMWFNVDGEFVGRAPATFQIIPRALRFVARNK